MYVTNIQKLMEDRMYDAIAYNSEKNMQRKLEKKIKQGLAKIQN